MFYHSPTSAHVNRVHTINVQLVTDPMIMLAKEEHGCDSGSESLLYNIPDNVYISLMLILFKLLSGI